MASKRTTAQESNGQVIPQGWFKDNGEFRPQLVTVEDAIRVLLSHIGEDIKREGLLDTPTRVTKAFREMTEGYKQSPKDILERTFAVSYDEMVIVRGIPFTSLCEHHLLVFTGTCDVGYIPTDRVIGLSKIPRLVDCFAKRLQVQERLTKEIAESIQEHVKPQGVGVVIKASHSCCSSRGIKKHDVSMITSSLLGCFRQPEVRAEFLGLCK